MTPAEVPAELARDVLVCVTIAPPTSTHHRPTVQSKNGAWMHVQAGDGFTDTAANANCPTCEAYAAETEGTTT